MFGTYICVFNTDYRKLVMVIASRQSIGIIWEIVVLVLI